MFNSDYRHDELLNELNDADPLWGPLLFLRPRQSEPMTVARVFALSVLVGGFYGMLGSLAIALLLKAGSPHAPPIWLLPAMLTGICFACCELTLARAWNQRARRLIRSSAWAAAVKSTSND
jgi:hypothetical protein